MMRYLRTHPALYGLVVTAAAALALSAVAATGALMPGDLWLARRLQDTPGGRAAEPLADWLALDPLEYAIVATVAVIAARTRDLRLVATALLAVLALALNPLLKELIGRDRPAADELLIREPARGYGYPSGHAMTVVLVYGYAAIAAWRLLPRVGGALAVAGAVATALLIGWDRVYDGAHWPSDVAGGFTIALLLLALADALPRLAALPGRHGRAATPVDAGSMDILPRAD